LFPGLEELIYAPVKSDEIMEALAIHVTEVMTAMGNIIDYAMRAMVDEASFTPV